MFSCDILRDCFWIISSRMQNTADYYQANYFYESHSHDIFMELTVIMGQIIEHWTK